jgi:hypothetical protein
VVEEQECQALGLQRVERTGDAILALLLRYGQADDVAEGALRTFGSTLVPDSCAHLVGVKEVEHHDTGILDLLIGERSVEALGQTVRREVMASDALEHVQILHKKKLGNKGLCWSKPASKTRPASPTVKHPFACCNLPTASRVTNLPPVGAVLYFRVRAYNGKAD